MTRDEILALPAGSELDRLVAEKVMGWKRSKSDRRYWWCDPGFHGDTPHSLEVSRTPKFSSEIDAAWAVFEMFKGRGWDVGWHAAYGSGPGWFVLDGNDYDFHSLSGNGCEHAAIAICRAALLDKCKT